MIFRRALAAIALLCVCASAPAFAQSKSKAVVTQEVGQDFLDNATGAITPAIVRGFLTDVINSYNQWPAVNSQVNGPYTLLNSDMGALVNVSSQSTFTLILPQAVSPFFNGWSVFIKNVGPVSATLSPQNSTIGGVATQALSNGQGLLVFSDGANWQTFGGFGVGTVSSVGLSIPGSVFNIGGSPVTGSGTLSATFNGVTPNFVFSGNATPNSGLASPNFRALVSGDMPTPNTTALGGVYSFSPISHNFLTGINNSGTPQSAVPAVSDLATITPNSYLGNPTGSVATPQAGTLGRTADWNQNAQGDEVMVIDQVRLAASPQFVSAASGTITLNFNNGMNFNTSLTVACNPCTVVTPQNLTQTWAGSLLITNASQNASIAFSKPIWKFAGGAAPTASVTTNDVDVLNFICVTPNAACYAFYGGNYQ